MTSAIPSRRQLLLGGAMLATAGIAYVRTPQSSVMSLKPEELERVTPKTIGPWSYEGASGLVLPPPDALADELYDQQLARVYGAPNEPPIMLAIAYGSSQDGMIQVHRPEVCYPASGYALSPPQDTSFSAGRGVELGVRQFTATRSPRVERILYWVRIGSDYTRDWTDQRLAVVRANLAGMVPDGVLVRLSVIGLDDGRADALLRSFATQMIAALNPRGRQILLGQAR